MGTAVVLGDRVLLATTTTGTGTYQLGDAVTGYLTLAQAGVSSGVRIPYVCVNSLTAPTAFETGEGVYTSGSPSTLTRAQVRRNTTGGTSAINWGAGTKYIMVAPGAANIPVYDTDGYLTTTAPAAGSNSAVVPSTAWVLTELAGSRKSCLVQRTTDLTIPNTTAAAVTWSSVVYDDATIWSGGAPTRLTVPAGFTRAKLTGNVGWTGAANGIRRIGFRKNGAVGMGLGWSQITAPHASTSEYQNYATGLISCVAGDYFELYVFQGSGAGLDLLGAAASETWAGIELFK